MAEARARMLRPMRPASRARDGPGCLSLWSNWEDSLYSGEKDACLMSEPMVVFMGVAVFVFVFVFERGKKQSMKRKCSMAQPYIRRRKGMGRRKTRSPELLRMDKQRINR